MNIWMVDGSVMNLEDASEFEFIRKDGFLDVYTAGTKWLVSVNLDQIRAFAFIGKITVLHPGVQQ